MTKQRLLGLEFGRGIAASLVAMHHASNLLSQPRFAGQAPFHDLMRHFDIGVDFFFVLSGFIIMWIHSSDVGKPGRLSSYVARRWTRIYPPYWCVLIPLFLLYLMFPAAGIPSQHDPVNFVFSFLLLPYTSHPVLGVAWTLVFEVFFYTVFGLIILIGKQGWFALPLWAAAILWFAFFGDQASWPQNFFFSSLNIEFMIGIMVAKMLSVGHLRYAATAVCAGLAAFILVVLLNFVGVYALAPLYQHLLLGCGGGAIIAGLVEMERSGTIKFGRIAQVLGSASFSIYLVHSVIESWTLSATWRLLKHLPNELGWLVVVAAGIGAGLLFHRFVERPLIELIRRGITERSAVSKPV
jgi:peptidoglycan/LPS O-acetylase OafA/YrhL